MAPGEEPAWTPFADEARSSGLRRIADNVWIAEDSLAVAGGLQLPIRMTVIRLSTGDLLLHSPISYSLPRRQALERLGVIRFLLAPNVAHWMFVPQWQHAVPHAVTYGAPRLRERRAVRKAGVRIDEEVLHETPAAWSADLQTVLISAAMYSEIALFHRASGTLVLTDLVQNLIPETLPRSLRGIAGLLGVTAPHGKAPAYLRLLLRLGGRGVSLAARRLVGFAPERVIFAHGECFETHGTERLRRSLDWLIGPAEIAAAQRELAGVRVVITGASSGIGWTSALSFARHGASLVLAARREALLDPLARECEGLGARALVVATDVTDAQSVARLATQAVAAYGGIDVWINNAGTGVVGPYAETDMALHRRTIEVNLLGTMHGAHAALPVFLRQRRGTLINNISMGGWTPTPFAAAYTASKFALRGFTASIRQELAPIPGIKVCAVFPAMIDTPGFLHSANMSGKRLDPGPLLYQPEDVAATFLALIRHPRPEVAVGWPARLAGLSYATAPALTENAAGAAFRYLVSRAAPADKTEGTLLQAQPPGSAGSGGWLARKALPPAGQLSKLAVILGLAACMVVGVSRARQRGRGR